MKIFSHKNFIFALYVLIGLIVFLLPLQTRFIWRVGEINGVVWEYGRFSLYLHDLWILSFFVFAFFGLMLRGVFTSDKFAVSRRIFLWSLIFLIYVFASVFLASDRGIAFYRFLFLAQVIGFCALIARLKISRRFIFLMIALSGVWQALWGIIQVLRQSQSSSKWLGVSALDPATLGVSVVEYARYMPDFGEFGLIRFLRAYGGFPHPNVLGGFLAVALIAIAILYLDSRCNVSIVEEELFLNEKIVLQSKSFRCRMKLLFGSLKKSFPVTWLVCFIVVSLALWLSFSRSAWIGAIVGLGAFIFLSHRFFISGMSSALRSKFRVSVVHLLLALSMSFTFLAFLMPDVFLTRFGFGQEVQRLERASVSERMDSYQDFFQIFQEDSFFGVGIGNYTVDIHERYHDRSAYALQPVHNLYVLIIAELGFLGFILFLLFSYIRFREYSIIEFYSTPSSSNIFSIGILVIMIVMLIMGLFDHYFWTNHAGLLLWWMMFFI